MSSLRFSRLPGLTAAALVLAAPLLVHAPASAAPLACDLLRPYRDLDGDGFEDVAIGDPYATVDGQAEAGSVTIRFGDEDGVIGGGSRTRVVTQNDTGEVPEAGDHFGWAVAMNRTTTGGCTGLVIGVPGEDDDGIVDSGMAHVFTMNGTTDGPVDDTSRAVDQNDTGGTYEAGDEFGYSVAALGGRDEYPVVFAFGAPGENDDAGVVNRTNSNDISDVGTQIRQGAGGVPGTLQAGDRFGEAIGFFDYLPVTDAEDYYLYVGAPGDVVSGKKAAGSVTAVSPLSADRVITQNTADVPDSAETGDRFGASLAGSKLPPLPNPRQLAIGSPGEDVGSVKDAGSVTVLKRNASGPLAAVRLTQSTSGFAGSVEAGDQLGASVAYRDDRTLAIGIPGEDVGSVKDAGSAHLVRIGTSAISFPSPTLTEDSPGTPGVVKANSRFGSVVTGLPASDVVFVNSPPANGYGEAAFAISSPFQNGGSVYVVSSTEEPRSWGPAAGQTGVRFGQAVG